MAKTRVVSPERGYFSTAAPTDVPLRRLIEHITSAGNIDALRADFLPAASVHFAACRAALMRFDEAPFNQMTPEMRNNPVVQYLFEHHAPVHEAVVLSPSEWVALCPWNDHGHVLSGPIVQNGEIIGVLAFTRTEGDGAFEAADLADASALCSHLSAWFAREQLSEPPPTTSFDDILTPRERQVTQLVAQGLTNAQIGDQLCVSSETVKAMLKAIFRKTGVSSRVQLVARRQNTP